MYEKILAAVMLSIIAMVIVFIVLGLLALFMVWLRKLITFSTKKVIKEKKGIVKKQKITPTPKEKEVISIEEMKSEEVISVASAAIVSYLYSTFPTKPIEVINIKRITPKTLNYWTISGRQNTMMGRISISTRKKGGF